MNKYILFFCICELFSARIQAQTDPVLSVLDKEMKREVEEFKKTDLPPYFISYRVTDENITQLNASQGSLIQSNSLKSRVLLCEVRVGDYTFDNTHPVEGRWRDDGFMGGMRGHSEMITTDNNPDAITHALWTATQARYRAARAAYKQAKNPTAKSKSSLNDFARIEPVTYFEAAMNNTFDKALWEDKVRAYSKPFQGDPNIVEGDVSLQLLNERVYLVTNEGTRIAQNRMHVYLFINGSIRATDGDIVPLHRSFFAYSLSELPSDDIVVKTVTDVIKKLNELRTAPLAEPYTGPAILDAPAAGVFFHEIFGHRVEGHRLSDEMDGQTFKEKIGQKVLANTLNVYFDPTLSRYQNFALNGHYKYDDQGVAGTRVNVVEKGVLKTFLMSRKPMDGLSQSNGHGRSSSRADAVSRQSNLIVESTKPVATQELHKMLVQECKKQGKPYGYFFKDVMGGYTTTDRFSPNAFNIFPTEVYRVYVDGRPDELVRGVDLIGTPLAMFAEISAASNQTGLFTGFCGAESGSVPVSAVSPSLFVRRIETQKKPQADIESMLLKSPTGN